MTVILRMSSGCHFRIGTLVIFAVFVCVNWATFKMYCYFFVIPNAQYDLQIPLMEKKRLSAVNMVTIELFTLRVYMLSTIYQVFQFVTQLKIPKRFGGHQQPLSSGPSRKSRHNRRIRVNRTYRTHFRRTITDYLQDPCFCTFTLHVLPEEIMIPYYIY